MEKICQSCCMPVTEAMLGTEKDGSKNPDYCIYCYKDGAFVNPNMTLKEMTAFLEKKMDEMHIDAPIANNVLQTLPFLKRWKSVPEVI